MRRLGRAAGLLRFRGVRSRCSVLGLGLLGLAACPMPSVPRPSPRPPAEEPGTGEPVSGATELVPAIVSAHLGRVDDPELGGLDGVLVVFDVEVDAASLDRRAFVVSRAKAGLWHRHGEGSAVGSLCDVQATIRQILRPCPALQRGHSSAPRRHGRNSRILARTARGLHGLET